MLSKKDANELKKKVALDAYQRWTSRADIRKDPQSLKEKNPEEFKQEEQRQENYIIRETTRAKTGKEPVTRVIIPERIIRVNDLKDFPPDNIAQKAGVPVGRIQTIPAAGLVAEGIATGFLIAPDLLMTNHHVFPDKDAARQCAVNFLYERTVSGLQSGFAFEINPDKFYLSDEGLDYAIVFVENQSLTGNITLRNFTGIPLIATKGKVIKGSLINIIQYPSGGYKKYAYEDNIILDIIETSGFIQYTTDTEPGSSGSPAFNKSWELAALHHSGVPYVINGQIMNNKGAPWDPDSMSDDEIQWIANEGISISTLIAQLKTKTMGTADQQALLSALLTSVQDPVLTPSLTPVQPDERINGATTNQKPIIISSKDNIMPNDSVTLNFYGNTTVIVGAPVANTGNGTAVLQQPSLQVTTANGNTFMPEKKQTFDPDYSHRPGYDAAFLQGFSIKQPSVIPTREGELFMDYITAKPYVLNYHHYSLVMNKTRRFMMWSASNVDYDTLVKGTLTRVQLGGEDWRPDPRIPAKYQVTDADFYTPATKVDRGHIVRRDDNCWGDTDKEIAYANADSYHWTNCTPQHEQFNRDAFGVSGLWGRLENHITQELKLVDNKAILFAGPLLDNTNDPKKDYGTGEVQYPLKFWKIVLVNDQEVGLSAYGFILDQSDVIDRFGLEARLDFSSFKAQQATITRITDETGVVFDQQVYDADMFKTQIGVNETLKPFRNESQIVLGKKKMGEAAFELPH